MTSKPTDADNVVQIHPVANAEVIYNNINRVA